MMRSPRVCFSALLVLLWVAMPAAGQSVVSTRAGLVHYFEGVVALNGEPLQAQFGRFPEVGDGAELRTGQGRAEVLLGPGVILRLAEDSAFKMISSNLASVRLELLAGSAIVESKDALPGNSVTLVYKDWQARVPSQGVYRIDCNPAQLRIYNGEVEVRGGDGTPVTAKAGQTLPLGAVLVPDQTLGAPGDVFNEWAFARREAIDADNATAAQIVDDPALYPNLADASGLAMAGYTYFPPMMGNPYLSYSTYSPGVYGGYPGVYGGYGIYGYPFALGAGYTMRYQYPGVLPGRIGLPGSLTRFPSIGGYGSGVGGYHPGIGVGGYHPGGGIPTTSRPGLSLPSMPHPAAGHPVVHGGRH